jgi:hypothetical protein
MDEPDPRDTLAIIAGQYDCVAEVVAERDRLRAVVEAGEWVWYRSYPSCEHASDQFLEARQAFERRLVELDVSPTMGGTSSSAGGGSHVVVASEPSADGRDVGTGKPDVPPRFEMTEGQQRTIADAVEYANSGVDPTSPTYDPDQYGGEWVDL